MTLFDGLFQKNSASFTFESKYVHTYMSNGYIHKLPSDHRISFLPIEILPGHLEISQDSSNMFSGYGFLVKQL